ncbi:WD40 repeat-like protein [Moesziomyces antarcticus]|uniref:Related to WD repeat protein PWP1 n=1 Tax=Pseudozyma antarctica TaxID=84753 RepID=A0A5C3FEV1_PSEA2|nr:WD40 repeat-like protein [Moesziomyces antarcticus]GAK62378.1 WD40 repeat-like protein [Moesziomyces antarcticus]SPO42923.1 related to WD repeat protein PWP1 [Moesziomyces antarcticus]
MISALQWIARGKSLPHPKKYVLDDDEMDRVSKMANVRFEDAKEQLERVQRDIARGKDPFAANEGGDDDGEWQDDEGDDDMKDDDDAMADAATEAAKTDAKEDPDDLSRYNLDEYDDDAAGQATAGAFSNIRGLAVYQSNEDDPYITVQEDAEKDEDEEREELEIYPTDNLIITAKTEDDVSQLEAYVYAANDANLYVHHDLMLPSFPLCLEWLDYAPARGGADQNTPAKPAGSAGNFIAVGTMDPEIEVWSMDVVDGMYPDAILGRKSETDQLNAPLGTGKKKRKQSKARIANDAFHVDAVLGLSWNPVARNLLASASADSTVKLWDLSRPHTSDDSTAFRSFNQHTDKVQSVAWQCKALGGSGSSSANPAVLLTGSYDKTMRIFDTRTPDTAAVVRIGSDVESVVWNGWKSDEFLCSLESGIVQAFDIRSPSSASWTLQAHDTACTAVDISPHIPGCILTASSDRSIKLWNLATSAEAAPSSISLVLARDLGLGKIFAAKFSPNDPLTLAAAGSAGQMQVFNALSNSAVRKTYADRLRKLTGDAKVDLDGTEPSRGDGIVRVEDDSDDDDEADDMQD